MKKTVFALLAMALAVQPGLASQRTFGPATWVSSVDGKSASATLERTTGCKTNCNDEVDYDAIISIDCQRGSPDVTMIFWALGEERDEGKTVTIVADVNGAIVRFPATGQSSLNGISLQATLGRGDAFLLDLAAGTSFRYSVEGRKGRHDRLKGSGKAIRAMLAACKG